MKQTSHVAMHQTVPADECRDWITASLRDALAEAERGDFRFLNLQLTRADGKTIRVQIVPEG